MSFGGYDPGRRYRKRAAESRKRLAWILTFAAIVGAFSYWLGQTTADSNAMAYKSEASELRDEKARLEAVITELQGKVNSTQIRYQQLEDRYRADAPTGDLKSLTSLLSARMEAGITAGRLRTIIQAARPPHGCTQAVTKRFIANTDAYRGAEASVTFGEGGVIKVTGEGTTAMNEAGKPEAWYDPGKPVSISFVVNGKSDSVKTGLLPIEHTIITGGREYRFKVKPGKRSFIDVTADHCSYP